MHERDYFDQLIACARSAMDLPVKLIRREAFFLNARRKLQGSPFEPGSDVDLHHLVDIILTGFAGFGVILPAVGDVVG